MFSFYSNLTVHKKQRKSAYESNLSLFFNKYVPKYSIGFGGLSLASMLIPCNKTGTTV